MVIAAIRLVLELNEELFAPDSFLYIIGDTNFLVFAAWMLLVSVLITIGVSLLTPPPSGKQIEGLAFGTLTPEQKAANKESYNTWDIVASLLVVAIVAHVMISFNGQ